MALFGDGGTHRREPRSLVEFRAGKMKLNGTTVTPDTRKGLVFMKLEDNLMHFCWKDRKTGKMEDVSFYYTHVYIIIYMYILYVNICTYTYYYCTLHTCIYVRRCMYEIYIYIYIVYIMYILCNVYSTYVIYIVYN